MKGRLPIDGTGRRTKVDGFGGIELYHHGRYFTVTGWQLPDTSPVVVDRQEALDILYARLFAQSDEMKRSGASFSREQGAGFSGSDEELVAAATAATNGPKFGPYPASSMPIRIPIRVLLYK